MSYFGRYVHSCCDAGLGRGRLVDFGRCRDCPFHDSNHLLKLECRALVHLDFHQFPLVGVDIGLISVCICREWCPVRLVSHGRQLLGHRPWRTFVSHLRGLISAILSSVPLALASFGADGRFSPKKSLSSTALASRNRPFCFTWMSSNSY